MFTEDIETFFELDEFGVTVTIDGDEITGMFSEQPIEIDFVQTVRPVFICKSDDVYGVAYDSTLIYGAVTYKIKRISEDDASVITTLELEKQ